MPNPAHYSLLPPQPVQPRYCIVMRVVEDAVTSTRPVSKTCAEKRIAELCEALGGFNLELLAVDGGFVARLGDEPVMTVMMLEVTP